MLRKTPASHRGPDGGRVASMRPQRNAAENLFLMLPFTRVQSASMRPQRNAAENESVGEQKTSRLGASMRPQRNAAENRV